MWLITRPGQPEKTGMISYLGPDHAGHCKIQKTEAPGSENRERKYSGYDWYDDILLCKHGQYHGQASGGCGGSSSTCHWATVKCSIAWSNCSKWVFSVFPGWPVTSVHQTVTNSIAILEVCYITLQCWIPMFRDFSRVTYGSLFSQTRVSNLEFLFTLLVFPKGIPNFKAQWMQIIPQSYSIVCIHGFGLSI